MARVYTRNKPLPEVPKGYVTTAEALKLLGVSDVTFHKYRKANQIAPIGKRLNADLYSRDDIAELNKKMIRFY